MDPFIALTSRRLPTFRLFIALDQGRFALGLHLLGRTYALCFGRIDFTT